MFARAKNEKIREGYIVKRRGLLQKTRKEKLLKVVEKYMYACMYYILFSIYTLISSYIYIYIYICVCLCVCLYIYIYTIYIYIY